MNHQVELRALVVYESMFGNTATIARAVTEGLEEGGFAVTILDVHDVHDVDSLDPSGFDLLVVGGPTHAFSLSRPATRQDAVRQGAPATAAEGDGLREWIATLPPGHDHLLATFDTRATQVRHLPKAASRSAARLITRRGFILVSRPTGFLVTTLQGGLVDGETQRALAWGRSLALETRHRLVPVPTA
ncbi:flavodoxin [Nocardioides psychrotolerans]|uniref:Flavodoxin n=1 Tax=Nocardioides psychrotolerans TaxID=1005945 RepID=A0A1I3JYX4_9ACTN|nr:flavodoxin domain-containing protein [Nocardioides psychrotolerans]GEP38363.1 flavodoxin [Nocardioides psychrotolerans]SFI65413.1 Flavodoxin [Nocardioides psychrotolerans]